MIRNCIITTGLFLTFSSGAHAQETVQSYDFVPSERQPHFNPDMDTVGVPTLSLDTARPDFSGPLPAEKTATFLIDNQTATFMKTNLAESFQGQDSNLLVEPRFSRVTTGDSGLEKYSAEIRIGNVAFEKGAKRPTGWYVFAATDGEAVSLRTDSLRRVRDNMTVTLDDQITIGDLQAGVSTYVFDGTQLTFSYIETEASYSNNGGLSHSKKESFAGISLAREF